MNSENRNYWLKIRNDFFQSKEVKKLKSEKAEYLVIYIKLLLQAIERGFIECAGITDTVEEELAFTIDEDAELIKETLSSLEKLKLLIVDNNRYIFTDLEKLSDSESTSAARVRKHRKGKFELYDKEMLHSNKKVTESNTKVIPSNKKGTQNKETDKKYESNSIITESTLSDDAKALLINWLDYKEIDFQEGSIKTLTKRFEEKINKYGFDDICELVERCISNNWKEIYWNKLDEEKKTTKSTKKSDSVNKKYKKFFDY